MRRLLLALVVASLISPAAAPAARQPTLRERAEIVNSYPSYLRSAPAECIYFDILVSTRDRRYARVVLQLVNPMKQRCHRYWGNGYDILERTRGKWRTVWSGSTQPAARRGSRATSSAARASRCLTAAQAGARVPG